jgi:A/G-specific adenine glycosylase
MLQQTRVETVLPYYERWVERFPTLEALAEAEEDEVLKLWEGLGYYSRARRLHQGARVVRERYAGVLPRNSEGLRELPGIGDYSAGAIASIAFGEVVPAVDGNANRVLSRLYDLSAPSPTDLKKIAGGLVDRERPGDFNQALMELGALVCLPKVPACSECPVQSQCLAFERGTIPDRPARKVKKPVPEVDIVVLVAVARHSDGRRHLLLKKRPDSGLLAGMWEFPGVEATESFPDAANALVRQVGLGSEAVTGLDASRSPDFIGNPEVVGNPETVWSQESAPIELPVITHTFSHLLAHYRPFLLRVPLSIPNQGEWIAEDGLDEIPRPVAQQKIAKLALAEAGS